MGFPIEGEVSIAGVMPSQASLAGAVIAGWNTEGGTITPGVVGPYTGGPTTTTAQVSGGLEGARSGVGLSALSFSGVVGGARPTDPLPSGLCAQFNYDARRVFCGPTRIVKIDGETKRRIVLGRQQWMQFYACTTVTVMKSSRFLCEVPPSKGIIHTFWSADSQGEEFELFADWNSSTSPSSTNQDWMVDTDAYIRALFKFSDGAGGYTDQQGEALVGPLWLRFTASSFHPDAARYLPGKSTGVSTVERRSIIT